MLQNKHDLAACITAQAMRWTALSLALNDEDSAWKITLLQYPLSLSTPEPPKRVDLQHCGLQSVDQITALCGLLRDEEALGLRVKNAGHPPRPPKKGGKGPKADGT